MRYDVEGVESEGEVERREGLDIVYAGALSALVS